MDINLIVTVVAIVIGITLLYKVLPYRALGNKKPPFALLPKYKTNIKLPSSVSSLEDVSNQLKNYGFELKSKTEDMGNYSRGHILGDFSVKLAKVNLKVTIPKENKSEFYIAAAWVVAFDTGDFWSFLNELKQKFET